MLEKMTAADHYELIKLLGLLVDPKEFSHDQGWMHFKIKEPSPGVFEFRKDNRVFDGDQWDFAMEAASEGLFYGFVQVDPFETTLGIRAPQMMAEFVLEKGQWVLREVDDFNIRERSVAERRFEIGKDWQQIIKFLANS
ncbi:MAG: hypothetical protein JSU04_20450 [Bdellovibrionales bacterium]|nr:hypothetical protein [Bdellovibrionales bacterium]